MINVKPCKNVGDVISFLQVLTADCPITPIELSYIWDGENEVRIEVKLIKEA